MRKWLLLLIFPLIAGIVAAVSMNTSFLVDMLWFDSLGYLHYFLLRLSYRYGIFTAVALAFFLMFFINFWLASRFLGRNMSRSTDEKQRLSQKLRNVSMAIYGPLSLVLSIPIALPFFREWEKALFFFFGRQADVVDPAIGRDVSYYLFQYPIFELIQGRLVIVLLILFFSLAFLYWLENRLLSRENRVLPTGAQVHMTLLILFTFAIMGWGFLLERDALLFSTGNEPIFSGPGWYEWKYVQPLIWGSLAFFALSAITLIVFIHTRKGRFLFGAFFACFLICLLFKETRVVPDTWYRWFKVAKQVRTEAPFISRSITATREAYNIRDIEIRQYGIEETHKILSNPIVETSLRNLPVWDQEMLGDVYNQEQGLHTHYFFPRVDVDRYMVSGSTQQVYIAARELDFARLARLQTAWDKKHLYYTHGYGIVMTPSAQGGDESMTWFIRDIPTRSDYDLTVIQPRIYYGIQEIDEYDYVIAPNQMGEYDYPLEDTDARFNYDGKGGITLDSMLARFLFYWHYDREIKFLTARENIIPSSRLLIRRNIRDMIGKLTPFLAFDSEPYLVSTGKGLFWIQDAYTTSVYYPYSRKWENQLNYIRNSVKVVVDAYHGAVEYYISDDRDPIINAYENIYRPLRFRSLDQMDPELRKHIRYPRDLFQIQMEMFAKYHQTDPERFYNDEDTWIIPRTAHTGQPVTMRPYYLTLNLFDIDRTEFMLVCPMSPKDRDNLRALALAGCDGDRYGEVVVYRFPRGRQVYGPSQIYSLIDQDTEIAQQLTLWDQIGSQVTRGRIIILPVGDLILYVQPVYLTSASRLKIPELKRLIVSQGEVVAMAPSLEEAFAALENKVQDRIDRRERRFPTLSPEEDHSPTPVDEDVSQSPAEEISPTDEPEAESAAIAPPTDPAADPTSPEATSPDATSTDASPPDGRTPLHVEEPSIPSPVIEVDDEAFENNDL